MTIDQLYKRKDDYILSKLDRLQKEVGSMQKSLLELIFSDYIGRFDVKDGKIVMNARNMRLIRQLDRMFDAFDETIARGVNTKFGLDMLGVTSYNADYYIGMGIEKATVNSIAEKLGAVEQSIGISGAGEIIKGSYLDDLTKMPEVRETLKNYVRTSVAGSKGYQDYLRGFKTLVVGNKEVNGTLEKYYSQYAYDTFNQVDASINSQFATNLNLKYFIYAGGLISTSRAFCVKRAGKTFHVDDTRNWKNDPTLIGKNKEGYNPLIERGRYRCRHTIRYITVEEACRRGNKRACREVKK